MASKWVVPSECDIKNLFATCSIQPSSAEVEGLFDSMRLNNVHLAKEFEEYPNYDETKGDTCMHLAARMGVHEVMLWLLKLKPELMNVQNSEGRTPLHLAIIYRQFKIFDLLMENNADVTIADNNQWTPLMFACNFLSSKVGERRESINVLSNLLKNRRHTVRATNSEGWTAIHMSCREGDVTVLKRLVLEDVEALYLKTKNGLNAFHIAAMHNNSDILNFLATYTNEYFNMNTLDSMNESALHKAVRGNHLETVKNLVKMGAKLGVVNKLGQSLVHIAAAHGSVEVMNYLIEQHKQVATGLKQKVEQQRNLMKEYETKDLADYIHHSKIFEKLSEELRSLEWDVNRRDLDQNTALHLAAFWNQTLAMEWLLARGANPALKNRYGKDVASITSQL